MEMDDDVREAWAAIQEGTGEEQEETLAQNGGQEMDEDVREAWEAIGGADKGFSGVKAEKGDVETVDKSEARSGVGEEEKQLTGALKQSGVKETEDIDGVRTITGDQEKDPGFWSHVWEGIKSIWDDPKGEHGPLAYLGLNILSGLGTAYLKAGGGFVKGFVDLAGMAIAGQTRLAETAFNMLTNSNWHGASDAIKAGTEGIDKAIDYITPDLFALRGMYDGIEGAKETMGWMTGAAEMVSGLGGIGVAGKAVKGAAMMKKGMDVARAGKIAHRATAAGFGLGSYERMASDEGGVAREGRDRGFWEGDNWLQEFTAMAGGLAIQAYGTDNAAAGYQH